MFTLYIDFAKNKFGNLTDGSGTLIFDHAVRVHLILKQILGKIEIPLIKKRTILLAGLFHDLLEDTNTTELEIEKLAGNEVLSFVKEMTINFSNKSIKQAIKPLYTTSDELTLIKLADIYDNVRKSPYFLRKNGLKWYQTFFLPLLEEYKNWMNYKIKNQKKYHDLIKVFKEEIIQEIDFLKTNYRIFTYIIDRI